MKKKYAYLAKGGILHVSGSYDTAKNYSYKSTSYKAQAITISLAYDGTAKVWKVTVTGQPNA